MTDDAKNRRLAAQVLRQQGGAWLQSKRKAAGLSQNELAKLVGAHSGMAVAAVEAGRVRISPSLYRPWAAALHLDAAEFVRTVMQYYDPIVYEILFNPKPSSDPLPRAWSGIVKPTIQSIAAAQRRTALRKRSGVPKSGE
jgi:transcriptional regulator with XRE-family HTH domain